MDTNTIRILSIHGGGARGYVTVKFLQRFITQWGINANELWKYFDVICGASIGGILGCSFAYGKSPDEMEPFFLEKAKRLFTIRTAAEKASSSHNASTDSNRPSAIQKVALLANNEPFYQSPYEDSNYGHNILQQTLVDNFGDDTLSLLKTYVVIPSFEKDMSRYVMFSNYNDPMFIGRNEKIVNVTRATSAAPVYLPHHSFNEHDYIDGGIYANDPAEAAINIGKMVKPNATRLCVLDVGTGLGGMGFDGSSSLSGNDYAAQVLFELMNVAMLGSQEMVNFNLSLRSKRTLEQLYYYRFQPKFAPDFPRELDNSEVSWFNNLANIVNSEYTNQSSDISTFLGHLTL